MATTPLVVATPKDSWLKRIGKAIAKVIHIVANDAAPLEKIMVPVAKALAPQFTGEITIADNLFTKIVTEAVAAEAISQAAAAPTPGPQKLQDVAAAIGPAMDAWVTANFPGAGKVSAVTKAGLVNAVVAVVNEVQAEATPPAA